MSDWDVIWTTTIATIVGSVPAVFLGVAVGLRLNRSSLRNKAASDRVRYFADLREPGGILYTVRDWANSLESAAQTGAPIGIAALQKHSPDELGWFLQSGRVIDDAESDFRALIALTSRLHTIVDPRIGTVLTAPLSTAVIDDAQELAGLVNALIRQAQEAAAK